MTKPPFDPFEERLQQLAIAAQQQLPGHPHRQSALGQLIDAIMRSGKLCRPQRGQFLGLYEDIYNEALQDLMLFICKNIDRYNPQRGTVMAWVNMLLERRFFREAIPKILDQPGVTRMTLSQLDTLNLTSLDRADSMTDILQDVIASDPENSFKVAHIRYHPEITFQVVSQRRLLGESWESIAQSFEVEISTVSSFYYRCLKKFSPKLKELCTQL